MEGTQGASKAFGVAVLLLYIQLQKEGCMRATSFGGNRGTANINSIRAPAPLPHPPPAAADPWSRANHRHVAMRAHPTPALEPP